MSSDEAFWRIFRGMWRSWRGKRRAETEILRLTFYQDPFDRVAASRPAFFAVEENVFNPKHEYVVAWRQRWRLQGANDAREATLRTDIFNNIHYEEGWLNCVDHMRRLGFRHRQNDEVFELILRARAEKGRARSLVAAQMTAHS